MARPLYSSEELPALFLMNLILFRRAAAILISLLALGNLTAATPPFELQDGDRVLFIGDTFFEREVDYGHIETRLTAAFPDRNVTFRNLAWAGDTPLGRARASFDWNKTEADWLKRVKEQVALVTPTVAFLSYGMTAALESGEASIPKFKEDMGKLMDAIEEVSEQKVRFVLLGPIPCELWVPNATEQNPALRLYEAAIRDFAAERSAYFVDLINAWPEFAYKGGPKIVHSRTVDGIHLKPLGQNIVAIRIQSRLGIPSANEFQSTLRIPPAAEKPYISKEERARMDRFVAEANRPDSPSEILRSAIRKKNELFFHRWRPANWTYLLGFRKHEQGQNAVELPKFEPFIAEWEARIAKLRDLKNQDAATVKEVQQLFAAESKDQSNPNFKPQPVPTFDVAEGFEVTLWAENPMLYKPIQINWDAKGRLWVASSRVYPQIAPGQDAEDAVIVLEDTNGDGKAETSRVFADGLLIPTGVLPDNQGGAYVAASHQLLHFADKNGDGKADEKKIVLSSFGTEDTHHNLHTLRWGYDGHLYMNQSIYTHTHVETPHGVRRLNSAGIWRFNPDTWRMEIFTKGACNPWGHHWDQFGNSFFTDGAGGKGIYHAMEGATYFTYADMRREGESITPGNWPKFCSLELIRSPNFPADWQGDAITCDFRAHRIVRFKLNEAGSTLAGKEMPDLLRSTNVTFRPIDLRMGPDGALYIADWSNPIIQHGEVDFRDPRRDHEHGRIWRVAAKGGKPIKKQDLTKLSTAKLLDRTLSTNGWEQEQARRVLKTRDATKTLAETTKWLAKQTDPHAKLEAMWLHEAFGKPDAELTEQLASASDERLRAAAARQLAVSGFHP